MARASRGRTALLLYGSETGNAHDIAEEIGRMSQRLHFSTQVMPMNAADPNTLLSSDVTLMAISTTGQGDLPANSRAFWKKLLRKKLPPTYLKQVDFAIFGLGDSSYPQYNWAALKVHKRLVQLGAHGLVDKGEGDGQHPEGYDAAFLPWLKGLRKQLLETFPLESGIEPIPDDVLLQPHWLLSEAVGASPNEKLSNGHTQSSPELSTPPKDGTVELNVTLDHNKRLTSVDHFQDVRQLIFSTSSRATYDSGDVLTIYPQNASEDVDLIISLLGWTELADRSLDFAPNSLSHLSRPPPKPTLPITTPTGPSCSSTSPPWTLRHILTHNLDLTAIPRRSFFSLIAHFTADQFQHERLLEFANPELVDELFDYTTRPRRSILEVLQEFDTLKIPWQWAAAIFPELRGRQFSIASGGPLKHISPPLLPHDHPVLQQSQSNISSANDHTGGENGDGLKAGTRFELLVAIVKYRTIIRKTRRGVCTRYLEGLEPGTRLRVTLQKGGLGITAADLHKPVVMVGPGTGLAPIRALIWERWGEMARRRGEGRAVGNGNADGSVGQGKENVVGESVLFFGCRSEKADYFFREEWERLGGDMDGDSGVRLPLKVITAFSRDQAGNVYVQDRIREEGKMVYKLLAKEGKDGILFICGSSGKMPLAVRAALVDVFAKEGKLEAAEAEVKVKEMEKEGRYKQETW